MNLLAPLDIATPQVAKNCRSSWAQYTIRVENREAVQASLKEAGVNTAVHYPSPLNRQPAVADPSANLPVGDRAAQKVMSLPMQPLSGARNTRTDRQCACEGAFRERAVSP